MYCSSLRRAPLVNYSSRQGAYDAYSCELFSGVVLHFVHRTVAGAGTLPKVRGLAVIMPLKRLPQVTKLATAPPD